MEIINGILDFSKIEAGKLAIESTDFWLEEVLDHISSIITLRVQDKDLRLTLSTDNEVPEVLSGDPLRLGQVLLNLTSNAVKFTERGEIAVNVGVEERDQKSVTLRFSVQDTGIGISEHQVSHVFDAFTQADESTTRRFGGTGLGLAICKQLVELMGGQITVQSTAGEGSTFSFVVAFGVPDTKPLKRRESAEIDLPPEILNLLQDRRVLLVEDNVINQQIATEILRAVGVAVEIADNGREAVQILRATAAQKRFSAVLMDLQMPIMNGYEASRLIRQETHLSTLPIIALTAHTMAGERGKCLDAGMIDHVSKPIDPVLLLNTLARWMAPIAIPTGNTPSASAMSEADELPNELPGLDIAAGVKRLGGSSELYRRLLQEFATTKANSTEEILKVLAAEDLTGAREIAHAIKGIAGNLSATTLHQAAAILDNLLEQKSREKIPHAVDNFDLALRETLTSIQSLQQGV